MRHPQDATAGDRPMGEAGKAEQARLAALQAAVAGLERENCALRAGAVPALLVRPPTGCVIAVFFQSPLSLLPHQADLATRVWHPSLEG